MGHKLSKADKIKIIKERDKELKVLRTYLAIKVFLKDYIYGDKTISPEKGLDIYLVNTNSIPIFIGILKENFKKIKTEKELEEAEKNLKVKLLNYEYERTIKIYDSYQQCLDIIKDKKNNEFIVVNENFIKYFLFERNNYLDKKVKLIDIDKGNHVIKIKFPASEKELFLEEIKEQKGYFKFSEEKNKTEFENTTKIIPNNISQISDNNNGNTNYYGLNLPSEIQKKEEQKIKEEIINSKLESIIYCLLNIKSFNEKFINYSSIITKDKIISRLFLNLILQKQNKINIFNCSDLIETLKSYYKYDPNIGVEHIYKILHEELKQNPNENSIRISQDSNNPNPNIEIQNVSNKYIKDGTSIILDLFYLQNITTFICYQCHKVLSYESFINNHIIFNLKEIYKIKNSPYELKITDCFDYLIRNEKQNGMKCPNCLNITHSFFKICSVNDILTVILDRGEDFQNHDIFFRLNFKPQNLTKYFFNESIMQMFELIGFCSFYKDKNRCIPFYLNYEDNKWYCLNNTEIELVSSKKDIGSPFLLFLKKLK